MTKYIENVDNTMVYTYTDKNNQIQSVKIANYALKGLFTLKLVTNTKNVYKESEKLVL